MNNDQFNNLLERRLDLTRKVLSCKNKEYASDTDRLHNFKVAAQIGKPETPERALLGMLKKHIVSVLAIIDGLDSGVIPSQDRIDEKIGDSVNYLILLEALLTERGYEISSRKKSWIAFKKNIEDALSSGLLDERYLVNDWREQIEKNIHAQHHSV